jgi:hypothetical protein
VCICPKRKFYCTFFFSFVSFTTLGLTISKLRPFFIKKIPVKFFLCRHLGLHLPFVLKGYCAILVNNTLFFINLEFV